ncbi:hypothetical protein ITP53_07765 [Nonomuraea sp. K274]|uniref:Uncharacterized protein n=1 Tax=Nonomuraea cypriaca TaxID=1187855 RepID=A0A931A930_9ACTN|nr:hypothetical protein [Nonomuraea cypriaca]MBF8185635.1 hypothetical protein [Nonomuraea cypriaca]
MALGPDVTAVELRTTRGGRQTTRRTTASGTTEPQIGPSNRQKPTPTAAETPLTHPLTVEDGAAADFRVPGTIVESVLWKRGRGLVLTLDRPAPADATVSYVAHRRAGPRVIDALGMGLLAFQIPVE